MRIMCCLQVLIFASFFAVVTSYWLSHNSALAIGASPYNNQRFRTSAIDCLKTPNQYQDLKFTICGGGAFSLAMAKVLSHKNISVNLLVRNQTVADFINENHFHPKYLSDKILPSGLWATSDPQVGFKDTDYIIHAVPCQESRKFLTNMKQFMPPKASIFVVTKGVEDGTFCFMSEIIQQTLGEERRSAYLGGPSFASEIMDGYATTIVIASEDGLAGELSAIMSSANFRCHTTSDVKVLQ
jgi:glycerol-3-phosphate dehydrogenase